MMMKFLTPVKRTSSQKEKVIKRKSEVLFDSIFCLEQN